MALPSPFQVCLEDQAIANILGALGISRKHVVTYDGATYRNTLNGHQISILPPALNPITGAGSASQANTATPQVPGTVTGTVVNSIDSGATTIVRGEKIIIDDIAAAIEPHPWMKIRTRVEFWDSADVGIATTIQATLTSGSATIVVPNNRLLTPGQKIAGTGIPVGATVLSLSFTDFTSVIISAKATASGDNTMTLAGSNYLGGYWDDEELAGASSVALLM